MSPEQANASIHKIDGRSDVWSLGAVIFTLLTGQFVHQAATLNERLIYAATRPARSLRTVAPSLDSHLISVVDRALAFDREARWQSAREMQSMLRGGNGASELRSAVAWANAGMQQEK